MNERDYLAERFEENRTHLRAVAYRMLGSSSEVDDAVQEAWLRLSRADAAGIDNLGGWLTTVVARVCLDMLRARKSRREEPITPQAPEPVATGTSGSSPEHEALLADSVGLALLVVLDRLTPAERLAFVLHDMFAVPFEEIATIVGRSADGDAPARQPRARRVRGGAGAPEPDLVRQREVVDAFWRRYAAATSKACSPSSIRVSSFARTCGPVRRAGRDPRRGGLGEAGGRLRARRGSRGPRS